MLDTTQAGENTDGPARTMRGLLNEATATLEQLQAELRAARRADGAGVDWPQLLARVELANAQLRQVIVLVEGRQT